MPVLDIIRQRDFHFLLLRCSYFKLGELSVFQKENSQAVCFMCFIECQVQGKLIIFVFILNPPKLQYTKLRPARFRSHFRRAEEAAIR